MICSKCIMDSSASEITFDENGVCSFCHQYKEQTKELKSNDENFIEELNRLFKKIKGNCIIGLSGGTDSSYVAYLLWKYDVNPIAVVVDNHWDSDIAKKNVLKILKKTDWKSLLCILNWEEFKDLQLAFLKAGVRNIEIPTDHAITSLLYLIAFDNNCKYIIDGGNIVTEAIMPQSWGYYAQDGKYIKAIHDKFGTIPLKSFPLMTLWDWFYYIFIKRIKKVSPLNYINYNRAEAKKILKKEFGWQDYGEKHWESIYTHWFQTYFLPKRWGIDKRKAHYSTLINSGQMTRNEALERIREEPFYFDDLVRVVNQLKIEQKTLDELMALPKKSYKDYPNNAWAFNENSPIRKLYRLLK